MTKFYFPDSQSFEYQSINKINDTFENDNNLFKDLENKYENNFLNVNLVKSELTVYLEDTLTFMKNNNLIPDLPANINIKYINASNKEILVNKLKDIFGSKPIQYNYPASTNIYNSTIYISNHYQEDDYSDNAINQIRMQFGGNIKQAVEYSFFHELGHLFLIEKNKDKMNSQDNKLFKNLSLNIEESFAESFAIHLLSLKYPILPINTFNFANFSKRADNLSNNISKIFYMKRNNLYKYPMATILKNLIIKEKTSIEEMFNSYEFPLVYEVSPFKKNNTLITNMNVIFDKCFECALENNKQVIINKFNNTFTKIFKEEFINEIKKFTYNDSNDINSLIESFHKQIKDNGFIDNTVYLKTSFSNSGINSHHKKY